MGVTVQNSTATCRYRHKIEPIIVPNAGSCEQSIPVSSARYTPTMLLLDYGMHRFTDDLLVPIMEALSDRKIQFQSVVALPRGGSTPVPTGTGWTVAQLFEADGRHTSVKQG